MIIQKVSNYDCNQNEYLWFYFWVSPILNGIKHICYISIWTVLSIDYIKNQFRSYKNVTIQIKGSLFSVYWKYELYIFVTSRWKRLRAQHICQKHRDVYLLCTGKHSSNNTGSLFTFSLSCCICLLFCEHFNIIVTGAKCSTHMDVGFLLDSSGSIRRYYNHEKKFLIALTDSLGISKYGSHAGVITFR